MMPIRTPGPAKSGPSRSSARRIFGILFPAALARSLAMTLAVGLPEIAAAKKKRVGNSYEFEMQGNPSTGYKWKLNKQASTGLDVVSVAALGYGNPKSRKMGAPAPFIFRITCIGSGFAKLQFDYVSPGSNRKVAKSHTHDARCE